MRAVGPSEAASASAGYRPRALSGCARAPGPLPARGFRAASPQQPPYGAQQTRISGRAASMARTGMSFTEPSFKAVSKVGALFIARDQENDFRRFRDRAKRQCHPVEIVARHGTWLALIAARRGPSWPRLAQARRHAETTTRCGRPRPYRAPPHRKDSSKRASRRSASARPPAGDPAWVHKPTNSASAARFWRRVDRISHSFEPAVPGGTHRSSTMTIRTLDQSSVRFESLDIGPAGVEPPETARLAFRARRETVSVAPR